MFYPKDFKEKVKSAYPDNEELHRELDNGDIHAGKYLYDDLPKEFLNLDTAISAILTATSLEELQNSVHVFYSHPYHKWAKLLKKTS